METQVLGFCPALRLMVYLCCRHRCHLTSATNIENASLVHSACVSYRISMHDPHLELSDQNNATFGMDVFIPTVLIDINTMLFCDFKYAYRDRRHVTPIFFSKHGISERGFLFCPGFI